MAAGGQWPPKLPVAGREMKAGQPEEQLSLNAASGLLSS